MGLFARVDDGGVALRLGGGQHDVDGRAHRGHVQIDLRAVQPVRRFGRNHAAVGGDLRAQRLKALDVLVDGAVADGAAAGVGNLRLAKARQQRTHEIIGCAQPPRVRFRHKGAVHPARINGHGGAVQLDFGTQFAQNAFQREGIAHLRKVFDRARLVAQQRRRYDCQRRVFSAVDHNGALEPVPAVYPQFFCHVCSAGFCASAPPRILLKPLFIIHIKPRPDKSNGVFTRGSNAKWVAFGGKIHYHEYG